MTPDDEIHDDYQRLREAIISSTPAKPHWADREAVCLVARAFIYFEETADILSDLKTAAERAVPNWRDFEPLRVTVQQAINNRLRRHYPETHKDNWLRI